MKPPNISRDSTINKSFSKRSCTLNAKFGLVDNDISRDSDTKYFLKLNWYRIHSRNKSQNVILFKPNILKEIEEDKQENVDFYIKKTRRERQIAELQIKRIAQEQPELLDDKSKEIIRRIDTRNLK